MRPNLFACQAAQLYAFPESISLLLEPLREVCVEEFYGKREQQILFLFRK
jgi:hypothetical protein